MGLRSRSMAAIWRSERIRDDHQLQSRELHGARPRARGWFWSETNMLRTNLDLEFRVFEDSDSKLEELVSLLDQNRGKKLVVYTSPGNSSGPTTGCSTISRARRGTAAGATSSAPMTRMAVSTTASLSERHPCRADERYAAPGSQIESPWHRPACERHRRSLQRPYRRVPHLARPAFRRLDRDHLEQHERPRCICSGRGRRAGRRGCEPPPLAGAGVVVCLMG